MRLSGGLALPTSESEPVDSSKWAVGLTEITIRDAACAFAGIHPSHFDKSPRAQAIFKQIKYDVEVGWVPFAKDLESPNARTVIVPADKGPPKANVKEDDVVPVHSLESRYDERGWDTSWIIE